MLCFIQRPANKFQTVFINWILQGFRDQYSLWLELITIEETFLIKVSVKWYHINVSNFPILGVHRRVFDWLFRSGEGRGKPWRSPNSHLKHFISLERIAWRVNRLEICRSSVWVFGQSLSASFRYFIEYINGLLAIDNNVMLYVVIHKMSIVNFITSDINNIQQPDKKDLSPCFL